MTCVRVVGVRIVGQSDCSIPVDCILGMWNTKYFTGLAAGGAPRKFIAAIS